MAYRLAADDEIKLMRSSDNRVCRYYPLQALPSAFEIFLPHGSSQGTVTSLSRSGTQLDCAEGCGLPWRSPPATFKSFLFHTLDVDPAVKLFFPLDFNWWFQERALVRILGPTRQILKSRGVFTNRQYEAVSLQNIVVSPAKHPIIRLPWRQRLPLKWILL